MTASDRALEAMDTGAACAYVRAGHADAPALLTAHRTGCTMTGHLGCWTITHGGHTYTCHRYFSRIVDRTAFVIARDGEWLWSEALTLAGCKARILTPAH
jgi:hypothetical protein